MEGYSEECYLDQVEWSGGGSHQMEPVINGIYEVTLIKLSNLKIEEVKQTIIKQCELKMTLSKKEDYNIQREATIDIHFRPSGTTPVEFKN